MHFFRELLLGVDEEQAVRGEDEEIIVFLDLVMKALGIRNEEFLVGAIADGSTDGNLSVDPGDSVAIGNQPIHVQNPVDLILPFGILINCHLLYDSVGLHDETTGVTDVAERNFSVLD